MSTKKPEAAKEPVPRILPRGRHGLSRQLVRQSQRTRLMDAMAELTAEKGYAAVTIAEIVARGSVAKRTFYEYFEDKEACFKAAGQHLMASVVQAITIPHDPDQNLFRRAESSIRGLVQILAARPAYTRAFVVEFWAAGANLVEARLENDRTIAQLLVAFSREVAAHQPDAESVSEAHALAVIEAIGGYIYRIVFTEGAEKLPDHTETLAELTIGLLMARMPRLRNANSSADQAVWIGSAAASKLRI
jgi:AcrR family transcriptional regulator